MTGVKFTEGAARPLSAEAARWKRWNEILRLVFLLSVVGVACGGIHLYRRYDGDALKEYLMVWNILYVLLFIADTFVQSRYRRALGDDAPLTPNISREILAILVGIFVLGAVVSILVLTFAR
jgi:hypothetical protein